MHIKTTKEVWAVMHASHPELKVFCSYSAPDGSEYGDPDRCEMMTEYGFPSCDEPIMGARTTWDKAPKGDRTRPNEKTEYWLCNPVGEED
jgi:hypothetical protein